MRAMLIQAFSRCVRWLSVCALLFVAHGAAAQQTLTTTFSSNNGSYGNMFDVVATNDVVIRGFDVNLDPGTWDVEVYRRTNPGSFLSVSGLPSAWTLMGSYTVTSIGADLPTPLPKDLELIISAGTTQAFYITTTGAPGMNYTNGTAVGNVYAADANLQILEGAGVIYPFGTTFMPRVWNGTIHYGRVIQATPGFLSIQQAINIASNGDLIQVAPGTYTETIDFLGKAITVRSTGGPAVTTIDGVGGGPTVSFVNNEGADSVLSGFTVTGGQGGLGEGGGIHCSTGTPTIEDCVITGNTGGGDPGGPFGISGAGGIHIGPFGGATIRDCVISSNQGGSGIGLGLGGAGGLYAKGLLDMSGCQVTNNVGGNRFGGRGGAGGIGIGVLSSIDIRECTITGNTGGHGDRGGAGGVHTLGDSATTVDRCTISGNLGGNGVNGIGGAGGMDFDQGGQIIVGCMVHGNQGGSSTNSHGGAGGINVEGDTGSRVLHCTIANNTGGNGSTGNGPGGILYFEMINSGSILENSIVWGNTGTELMEVVLPLNATTPVVSHSDIEGGWPGTNNIDADPIFTDMASGDLHLQAASPCLDMGDATVFGLPTADIDGDPRIVFAGPDMGADEIASPFLSGSGEDLALEVLVNGVQAIQLAAGDALSIRIHSPNGTFDGTPPVIAAQIFPNGSPPSGWPGLPEVHLDPGSLVFLFLETSFGPLGPVVIPPGGFTLAYSLPASMPGYSIRIQGFAFGPLAAVNGLFAATGAHDLVFQ